LQRRSRSNTARQALWLQASLAHEERRYADALATWQRLLAVVPPGSSDARIVEPTSPRPVASPLVEEPA